MAKAKKSSKLNDAYDFPFPTRLRDLLSAPGETQGKLADAIGVQRQSIGQWKDGITSPDVNAFNKIANYYNVSADYLLGRTTEKSPDIDVQAIHKKAGLSEKAIRNLQSLNSISDEPVGNYELELRHRLNSFLEHPKIREFIYNIQRAKQCSESTMSASITEEEYVAAVTSTFKIGSELFANHEVKKFYRQEAINALRDIVYDLIPDRKDKKEE